MGFPFAPTLTGMATATLATTVMVAPATAATFAVDSGVTSVFLNFEEVLNPLGIELAGTEGVATPAPGPFQVGFTISPTTDFTFSDENTLTPLSGTIEHTGTVTLAIDTLPDDLTLGNFTIGFDPERVSDTTTGFFVQDTTSLNIILFDLTSPPTTADLTATSLTLGSDLAIAPEFADVLASIDKPGLTGAVVGSAQINADLSPAAASVPEPASTLGLLLTGAAVVGIEGYRRGR